MWKEEVVIYFNLLPRHAPGEVKELWEIPVRAVEARSSLNTLYTHHL
jgi:hypothetical protein